MPSMICSIILPPVSSAVVITEKSMPVTSKGGPLFFLRGAAMVSSWPQCQGTETTQCCLLGLSCQRAAPIRETTQCQVCHVIRQLLSLKQYTVRSVMSKDSSFHWNNTMLGLSCHRAAPFTETTQCYHQACCDKAIKGQPPPTETKLLFIVPVSSQF